MELTTLQSLLTSDSPGRLGRQSRFCRKSWGILPWLPGPQTGPIAGNRLSSALGKTEQVHEYLILGILRAIRVPARIHRLLLHLSWNKYV